MKQEEPKSLKDFLKIFNQYNSNGDNYYRGQADLIWNITPSLGRNRNIKNPNLLLQVEKKMIGKFQYYIKENNLDFLIPNVKGFKESWVITMIAQHCGLPTRLLDFSHDKIIALLFAIADIQFLNKNGALIIYENPTIIQKSTSVFQNQFSYNLDKSFFIPAPILMNTESNDFRLSERRKFLQGSKFLYRNTQNLCYCLSNDQEHTDKLTKIHINRDLKLNIINEIIKKGEMVYDLFAGKNELDFFAAILKLEFNKLEENNIDDYLKSNLN